MTHKTYYLIFIQLASIEAYINRLYSSNFSS